LPFGQELHHRKKGLQNKRDDPTLKGKGEIIIGKQRNGPIGRIDVAFIEETARFTNLAATPEPEDIAEASF